jgi:DNA/RNA endonuclease G (NUC1)
MKLPLKFSSEPVNQSERDRLLAEVTSKALSIIMNFVQSHGVKTPDAFWKAVVRGSGEDKRAIAWIVPDATRKNLDRYLVSIDELGVLINMRIHHQKP